MKSPADALVEWRCSCGDLVGFLRRIDGQLAITLRGMTDYGGSLRWEPDRPYSTGSTMSSTCGRHWVQIAPEGQEPRGRARRVVILPAGEPFRETRRKISGQPLTLVRWHEYHERLTEQ